MNEKHTMLRRSAALLICLIMLTAAFSSALFLLTETDHDCTGHDCMICACIRDAEHMLSLLGTAAWGAAVCASVVFLLRVLRSIVRGVLFPRVTPLSLHVRLNN